MYKSENQKHDVLPGMTHTYNPSPQEIEAGRLQA